MNPLYMETFLKLISIASYFLVLVVEEKVRSYLVLVNFLSNRMS